MPIKEVSVEELATAIASGARVIDVRETDEYGDGHVPGAVHIPLGAVADQVDAFRGESPAYIICKSGGRSMRACEFLAEQGIAAINVAGGTMAWTLSDRDVVIGAQPS